MSSWVMGFQSPWMLFATLGLVVPLVIHLLSKSKGKKVEFGDIRLLPKSKPVRMTQIRLVEPLLLLLRLLLLLLSIFVLAKFYWLSTEEQPQTIALVTPSWLNHAALDDKQKLISKRLGSKNTSTEHTLTEDNSVVTTDSDSEAVNALEGELYHKLLLLDETHLLAKNHRELSDNDILQWASTKGVNAKDLVNQNVWLLLEQISTSVSPQTRFNVYTTNEAINFFGNKISPTYPTHWHILASQNTAKQEEKKQYLERPMSVAIIGDNNLIDGNFSDGKEYINKALKLINQFVMPNLTVTYFANVDAFYSQVNKNKTAPETDNYHIDWLIGYNLSKERNGEQKKMPPELQSWIDQGGKLLHIEQDNVTNGVNSASSNYQSKRLNEITLGRFFERDATNEDVFKVNGAAEAWSSLIEQPIFPQVLLSLLLANENQENHRENGKLTKVQIANFPSKKISDSDDDANTAAKSNTGSDAIVAFAKANYQRQKIANSGLEQWWLILLLLLWVFERLLSEFSISKGTNVTKAQKASSSQSPDTERA